MEPKYKVGPGNPPLETQFKKGQSGNPKGRPKKPKIIMYDHHWDLELQKSVKVTDENGVIKEVPFFEAYMSMVKFNALNGDKKSMSIINAHITNTIKAVHKEGMRQQLETSRMSDEELNALIEKYRKEKLP